MALPAQVIASVREKLTEPEAWVAFGVRGQALSYPGNVIIDESAGAHRISFRVDDDGVLVYRRTFADGSVYEVRSDARTHAHLPAVAVGLEWADGSASLRLASNPQALPSAPILHARKIA